MRAMLEHEDAALLLFDFQAAFPSVSQAFIRLTLRHLGVPDCALAMVDSLYDRTGCWISLRGHHLPGFMMTSGIRQGCPLSPLLYAVCADSLLRVLAHRLPGRMVRAFADDTAMVLRDMNEDLPRVQEVFDTFGRVSNLDLNIGKTVAIPLGHRTPEDVSRSLRDKGDPWANMQVATWARYLGFATGPGKQDHSWQKPLAK